MAEHVHGGDSLHLVVGHTRWSAAAREVVRQWWGKDPHFDAGDVEPLEPGRAVLPGRPGGPGRDRLLGRHVPELHAEPVVPAGVPVRRGGGGALVLPRVRAAARSRGQGPARDRDPLDRGLVDGDQRRVHGGRLAVRPGRSALARSRPTSRSCMRRSPTRPATSRLPRRCSKGVWGALAARRGAIVTVEKIVPSLTDHSDLVRIPAHRVLAVCEAPLGAHPGGLYAHGLPGRGLRRGLRLLGRGPRRDPPRRLRRVDPPLDPRARETHGEYLERLGTEKVAAAAGQGPTRLVAPRCRASTRPTSRPRSTRGRPRQPSGRATSPIGSTRSARTRSLPAPASRTSQPGSASTSPAPTVRTSSSPRRSGSGATSRPRPTRSCSTTATSRSATMLGDAAMVLQTIVGGPATVTIGCLGGAQVDRHGNINSTLVPGRSVPRRLGRRQRRRERRGRGRGGRDPDPAADPGRVRLRHVAGSGGSGAGDRPRAGSRSPTPTASSSSARCRRGRSRSTSGSNGPGPSCGWPLADRAAPWRSCRPHGGGDRRAAPLGSPRLVSPRLNRVLHRVCTWSAPGRDVG